MAQTDDDLRELAIRSAGGDMDAFERLVTAVHGRLAAFLMLIGVPEHDVADLAQETYLALYQNLVRFDPEHSFAARMRGIARNVAFKHYRSTRSRAEAADRFRAYVRERFESGERLSAWESARRDRLRRCIDALPDDQRTAVTLRYGSDAPASSIGDALGQGAASVRKTLTRARLALRRCLEGAGSPA